MTPRINWGGRDMNGYEVSSKGDSRFSALFARMPDGRTIEQWYQCDVKGYAIGGTDWKMGKGKPSLIKWPGDQQWQLYLSLWKLWSIHNSNAVVELASHARQHNNMLTDLFATTPVNQAHALATIINDWGL